MRRILISRHLFFSFICALSALLLIPLAGCGGGTLSSEGSGDLQIKGVLKSTFGEALPGAMVLVEETGDLATTDDEGLFLIDTVLPGETATFTVTKDLSRASVAVGDLPSADAIVEMTLELDQQENTLQLSSINTIIPTPRPPAAGPTQKPKPPVTKRAVQIDGQINITSKDLPLPSYPFPALIRAKTAKISEVASDSSDSSGKFKLSWKAAGKRVEVSVNLTKAVVALREKPGNLIKSVFIDLPENGPVKASLVLSAELVKKADGLVDVELKLASISFS
jgi:hypothetical protein